MGPGSTISSLLIKAKIQLGFPIAYTNIILRIDLLCLKLLEIANLNYTAPFCTESRGNTYLKMPTSSIQPPSPAEKKMRGTSTCDPQTSSCCKFLGSSMYQKSPAPPPPSPRAPSGPNQSARPSSPAAELFCSWLTPTTGSASPPPLAVRLCIRARHQVLAHLRPASSSL